MSDVSALNNYAQSAAATSSGSAAEMGEEFNSFIKLLVAQVRNQDPLSPLDSTQFVEQLATFSSLEQQVQSNQSLQYIATLMADVQAALASQWIGQTVSVESSWVPYDSNPVDFEFDMPEGATSAVLTVRDNEGNPVATKDLDTSLDRQVWDGTDKDGKPVVAGLYQISIETYSNNEYFGSVTPRLITTVTNVSSENGQMRVGTAAGFAVDISEVKKVED